MSKTTAWNTPLHCSLENKSENAVREVLKQEAVDVVNVKNDKYQTRLHIASM